MEQKSKCQNLWEKIENWFKARFVAEETVMPAEVAYCRATYGEQANVTNLIKMHQHKINRLINEKTSLRTTNGDTFTDYRCVYSFPTDMTPYISDILKIFKDKGYEIINLSEKIQDIQDEHVYLISWYRKFL